MFSDVIDVKNICRCCHSNGCFKNLATEYYHSGIKENYEHMLGETFDIKIHHYSSGTEISNLICDSCIIKLREAVAFKNMVVASETRLATYLETSRDNDGNPEDEIMETLIKSEVFDEEFDGNDFVIIQVEDDVPDEVGESVFVAAVKQEDGSETDDADIRDVINIKDEIDTLVEVDEACVSWLEQNLEPHEGSKKKSRKRKADCDENKEDHLAKIVERRGLAPIRRQNTLKLLINSTMFVFQWNKSWWSCFCCKESFMDMKDLEEHYNEHSIETLEQKIIQQQNRMLKVEISSLHCKKCKKKFETIQELRDHLTKKHKIQFDSPDDLLVPYKIQTEGMKCQICSEVFPMFRQLNIHVNRHYKNHVCHICGASFANLVFLNLHKTRSHRTFNCSTCDITFETRTDKKNHDKTEHNVVFERKLRFPCPFCHERFLQENFKIQHMVDKHGLARPQHKCQFCDKVFITKSLCNNHIKNVHMKEKKHECDICHNLFYTKSDMTRHRVTHTGEKNFSCFLCNNVFSTRDSLRRHLKRTHDVTN